jgi:hypothetical protein
MIRNNRKKLSAKPEDLYESAWAALRRDSELLDLSFWRKAGWKPVTDFPEKERRMWYYRLLRSNDFESIKQKVKLPGGVREITLFRPIIPKKQK